MRGGARRRVVALALAVFMATPATASPQERAGAAGHGGGPRSRLERANGALRAWIAAVDADVPFLLLDRGRGRLHLQHGEGLLRDCRVLVDSLGSTPAVRQVLEPPLRRFRRAGLEARPAAGPFDWEQYLAEAATPDGALYFDSGLLLYSSPAWGVPRSPSARLSQGDLRALCDALSAGAVLVILPAGWQSAGQVDADMEAGP